MIVYALCVFAEILLYAARGIAENIVNQHYAASQMAVSTGFVYGDVIKWIDIVCGVSSFAILLIGISYYFLHQKGNRE